MPQELESYYKDETVYQRLAQTGDTVELLQSAANRINAGAKDYKAATGLSYSYKDISYPQPDSGTDQPATLEQMNLLNADAPLTHRLQMVGQELLAGKEALAATNRGVPFLSLDDRATARGEVKKLVDETARTMDDLMVKLIGAKHSKIPAGGAIEDYLDNIGIRDLMMTRVALAGTPPDKLFEDAHDASGLNMDGLRKSIAYMEKEVKNRYGAPETTHLTVGSEIQGGIRI